MDEYLLSRVFFTMEVVRVGVCSGMNEWECLKGVCCHRGYFIFLTGGALCEMRSSAPLNHGGTEWKVPHLLYADVAVLFAK